MKKVCLLWYSILLCLNIPYSLYAQLNVSFGSQINYTQAVNDIWGYTDSSGNEYALVGTQTGLAIVDVSDPAAATELHFISGPNNTWRDVHTWSHYAYMVTESSASGGLLVIDLAGLPATIDTFYTGMGFGYYSAHTLYIDDNSGVGYLFGGKSSGQGNATFFVDIAANPTNPIYLGKYSTYVHDGYVRNDTMWTGEIYAGRFSVVDVSNKANPIVLASQVTPYTFTHTAWLSDDSHYLFITDEKNAAPVVAYDVSDIYDIKEVDRYRTKPLSDSMVVAHNDYVKDDFLISSYYTAGITIADITYPYNIIEVGNYDTSPYTGGGFNGCWGVFPYFSSGTLLATDRQEGLFVLAPTYVHACWLEGTVSNILNNAPILNAQVSIVGVEAGYDRTDIMGFYATGTAISATYQVIASAPGYHNDTISITLSNGVLSQANFALIPLTYCSNTLTGFSNTSHTDTSAIFIWDNMSDAQQYSLYYRPTGSLAWQSSSTTQNETTLSVDGLIPCTSYEYYLQGHCNYGINSTSTTIDTLVTAVPSAEWIPTSLASCNDSINLSNLVVGRTGGTWTGGSYISLTGMFNPNGLVAGNYPVTYTVSAGSCVASETHDISVTTCFVTAHIKVILGGAYQSVTADMRTSLVANNLLPTTQPYSILPWQYNGTESVGTLPANAVDWVLVELRPAANVNTIAYQSAAILLQDGSVVSSDGTSGIKFWGADTANYYIVVRHRNHLAIVSNTAVTLPNTALSKYDFTMAGAAMGGNQTYLTNNINVYAMRPGDMEGDGVITVEDFNVYLQQISQINVYKMGDLNLDRSVTTTDFNLYLPQASFIGVLPIRY